MKPWVTFSSVRKLGLVAVVLVLAAWCRAKDSRDANQRGWWLASNFRVVTYEFLERGHRESDLSGDEILVYLDRLGGCDVVLLKGFHYWQGSFDSSSWGYPRFRALAEGLIPRLHKRGIRVGIFGFTDRRWSYRDGRDHRQIMEAWREYVRLGADMLFVDEESGIGGLDIPDSCLGHCDELREEFHLPVGLFLYGPASGAERMKRCASHVDVVGEMGYTLSLGAQGDYGLEDVTRQWSGAVKTLTNRTVAYWTGAMVVEKENQGPGTPFWRERFGQRTLAGYFDGYFERALAFGADGVFFHSICRLSGLPAETQEEIAEVVKERFQKMKVGSGRAGSPLGRSADSDSSGEAPTNTQHRLQNTPGVGPGNLAPTGRLTQPSGAESNGPMRREASRPEESKVQSRGH